MMSASRSRATSSSVTWSSVLAAVTWMRNPTSSRGTPGRRPGSRRCLVEQEAASLGEVVGVGQRHLDDREPGAVEGVRPQLLQVVEDPPGPGPEDGPQLVATGLVDLEPGEHAGQGGDRGRPRVQVRGCGDLDEPLELGRAGDEGQQRR